MQNVLDLIMINLICDVCHALMAEVVTSFDKYGGRASIHHVCDLCQSAIPLSWIRHYLHNQNFVFSVPPVLQHLHCKTLGYDHKRRVLEATT